MLVPLYGFLAGDTLGVVILVQDHDTIETVAKVLQQAAAARVAPHAKLRATVRGKVLDPQATVASAGLAAFDRLDVAPEGG